MVIKYRKKKGRDVWHFCSNCSNWPKSNYNEKDSKPNYGELCNECKAKKRNRNCR